MSDERSRRLPRPGCDDFTIGIICALGIEARSVEDMFDDVWVETGEIFKKHENDKHEYTLGSVGDSYAALIWQMRPYGKTRAALAAQALQNSFRKIKYVLVVGVCGGMPKNLQKDEILLGDVIISTALHKYDEGQQIEKDYVTGPKCELGDNIESFLKKLQNSRRSGSHLKERCADFHKTLSKRYAEARHPGWQADRLFKASYPHTDNTKTCAELKCGEGGDYLVPRGRLKKMDKTSPDKLNTSPAIHFGPVGSANTVMKAAERRDEIAKAEKIIAFEMEGAGVWEVFRSVVVIKGVCDYADSHKNKHWQPYAATTATACARAFLEMKEGSSWSWAKQKINRLEDEATKVVDYFTEHGHLKSGSDHPPRGPSPRRSSHTYRDDHELEGPHGGFGTRDESRTSFGIWDGASVHGSLPDRDKELALHSSHLPSIHSAPPEGTPHQLGAFHGHPESRQNSYPETDTSSFRTGPPTEPRSHGHEDAPRSYSYPPADPKHPQHHLEYFPTHPGYPPPRGYYQHPPQQPPFYERPSPPQGYPPNGAQQPQPYPSPHSPSIGQPYAPQSHPMGPPGPAGLATPPISPYMQPVNPNAQAQPPPTDQSAQASEPLAGIARTSSGFESLNGMASQPQADVSNEPAVTSPEQPTAPAELGSDKSRTSLSIPAQEGPGNKAQVAQPIRPAPEPLQPAVKALLSAPEPIKPAAEPITPGPAAPAVTTPPPVSQNQIKSHPAVPVSNHIEPEPEPEAAESVPAETKEDPAQTQKLLQACEDRDLELVTSIVIPPSGPCTANINGLTPKGKTAIQLTLGTSKANTSRQKMSNIASIISLLCKHGADPETPDKDGYRPLHLCAKTFNVEAAMVLIDAGANVNGLDAKGRTPLYFYSETGTEKDFAVRLMEKGGGLGGKKALGVQGRMKPGQVEMRKVILQRVV